MFSLGIALPFERTTQLAAGGQVQSNILRPISGQLSADEIDALASILDENILDPTLGDNQFGQWSANGPHNSISPFEPNVRLQFSIPNPIPIDVKTHILAKTVRGVGGLLGGALFSPTVWINEFFDYPPASGSGQAQTNWTWHTFEHLSVIDVPDWVLLELFLFVNTSNPDYDGNLQIETVYLELVY